MPLMVDEQLDSELVYLHGCSWHGNADFLAHLLLIEG
jgi:hypothetical protein